MLLTIRHDTSYRYATPVQYSIQQLRMTPSSSASQMVRRWHIEAPAKLDETRDAYGNVLHTLVLTKPHSEIFLQVSGEIVTVPLIDGRLLEGPGVIPIQHYTCATPLTDADEAILEIARGVPALESPAALITLAERIEEKVIYQPGVTGVTSSAAEALALGNGVCQDHAHLMLACCRALGVPARYVSGYIDPGDVPHAASHAWVDVWLGEEGWISVDVTNTAFASGKYCRLAVGRDYEAAAPVRGTRVGGKEEKLDVVVYVNIEATQ
jgi:transglutaminase-like putative cysteine protease